MGRRAKAAKRRGHAWVATRGRVAVRSRMWTQELDLRKRVETCGLSFDVKTPSRRFRVEGKVHFRTYTAGQMARMLRRVPELAVVATYDFLFDIDDPIEVDRATEDVIYVLRKQ